jgi:hypothetical protein
MKEFTKELEHLINRHSLENGSDTPDFILAAYLTNCLKNFNATLITRKIYYKKPDIPAQEKCTCEKPLMDKLYPGYCGICNKLMKPLPKPPTEKIEDEFKKKLDVVTETLLNPVKVLKDLLREQVELNNQLIRKIEGGR